MRGNSSLAARLDGVPVAPDALLGAPGDQIWYVFEVVAPYFLTAMAGTYLGVAQAALDEATEHLRADAGTPHRPPAGLGAGSAAPARRPVGSAAGHPPARLLGGRGGRRGRPARRCRRCTSAKAEVADCAVVVVANEAMTLVGGLGYRDRSPLERHLRDARAAHVMSPTTDILRTWTGRALLGVPLLGD